MVRLSGIATSRTGFCPLPLLLLLFALQGCSTWSRHGVEQGADGRFRIALLPVTVTASIDHLSEISSRKVTGGDEARQLRDELARVTTQLTEALKERLSASQYLDIQLLDHADEIEPLLSATAQSAAQVRAQLARLGLAPDVQAVLLVRLAGYGKLKREWIAWLIGSGVVEGVVQGVVAARLVHSTGIGLAVALEEIGQELLMWGGGSYLFDSYYAPVTLEAELISTSDHSELWDDTVFVSIDNDAIKALPKEERGKKELQLELTARKAVRELSRDFEKAAERQLTRADAGEAVSGDGVSR